MEKDLAQARLDYHRHRLNAQRAQITSLRQAVAVLNRFVLGLLALILIIGTLAAASFLKG